MKSISLVPMRRKDIDVMAATSAIALTLALAFCIAWLTRKGWDIRNFIEIELEYREFNDDQIHRSRYYVHEREVDKFVKHMTHTVGNYDLIAVRIVNILWRQVGHDTSGIGMVRPIEKTQVLWHEVGNLCANIRGLLGGITKSEFALLLGATMNEVEYWEIGNIDTDELKKLHRIDDLLKQTPMETFNHFQNPHEWLLWIADGARIIDLLDTDEGLEKAKGYFALQSTNK